MKTVEMVVESVRVHLLSNQHVVILKDRKAERYLPIWIGPYEANAIALKLQGVTTERPLTHDLMASFLNLLKVKVNRVVVCDLADDTFHARVIVENGGEDLEIDSRPSDAIALAIRLSVPIFASEEVLDRAAIIPEESEDEKLAIFKEFINGPEFNDLSGGSPPGGSSDQ